MGSIEIHYSIPDEARKVLEEGILNNEKIAKNLPAGTASFARKINFVGDSKPNIPINWRFAESASSLKGLEACVVAELVKRKYNVELTGATINTDHAQLFFFSTFLWEIIRNDKNDPKMLGRPDILDASSRQGLDVIIPNYDFHKMTSSLYRQCATNIYRTRDGKYFHVHGSMNPEPTLQMLGLPVQGPGETYPEAMKPVMEAVAQRDSADLQQQASDVYKQAGVICESVDSFKASAHGQANAHVGLFEIHDAPSAMQPPSWWPDAPTTSFERPLAGLKVVDLTRVIAAPAVTRGLAELGASVMRVTSPNVCDYSALHMDLSWGKWNCSIDLKTEEGRTQLANLVKEADVVVQGYRPGVLDKYGFGQQGIIDLVKERKRGIISARENCYGWNGPWDYRSGWQQISDAVTGVSWAFGKAMGLEDGEAVTPVFPNSDYMTGIAGVVGILSALMRRAEKGGSYKVDLALNYYNQWLIDSCGEYPEDVWQEVWERNGKQVFRSHHNMGQTIPKYTEMIKNNSNDVLFNPKFWEERESKALGITLSTVKPIVKYEGDQVRLMYNVGTRGNGKDAPKWPEGLDDRNCEIVWTNENISGFCSKTTPCRLYLALR